MRLLRRFVPASMRARATVAATGLFALALLVGGIVLVSVLRRTMVDNVDTTLELRASDIGALLSGGASPESVAIVDEEDSFVQVRIGDRVVASSVNVDGEAPIVDGSDGRVATLDVNPVDDAAFRVLAESFDTPQGVAVVIVGSTLEDVDHTVHVALLTLLVGLPGLVVLAGATTWVVVGRSLRPVEQIRSEVTEIGATDLHRRVPVPSGDDEIARLAGTMNDMLDRIESGTMRQRRFVSDASHELRTPIATVRHELEVALAHSAETDWPSVAAEVLDEDLRMQRLVEDLLWLARHDDHAVPAPTSLVDLDDVVVEQVRRHQAPRGVRVDISGVGAGQVRGRPDDLTRVVQNLVDNALRHADSLVAVSVRSVAGSVVLDVDDDGPGVPPDLRSAVFERFTRSDEARDRDAGGAGLGLAIAADIVAEHGGSIAVDTAPLGGARFQVRLADARSE